MDVFQRELFFTLLIVMSVFSLNVLLLFSLRKYIAQTDPSVDKLIMEQAKAVKLQEEKAFLEARKIIADQVAHDIRSPLAAINTVLLNAPSIDEKRRFLICNAVTRINDIVNNILLPSQQG